MKVLILGNSDTRGEMVPCPTWAQELKAGLEATKGEPVEVREQRFWPINARAPEIAETKTREFEADVVVLPLGTFAFTVGLVWLRVEALFGTRVAGWYRSAEQAFDRRTRSGGAAAKFANRAGRRVGRRSIGVRPLATMEQTLAAYRSVIERLARVEEVQVVLAAYTTESANTRRNAMRERERFLAALREEASGRHFGWASCEETAGHGEDLAQFATADGFHLNDAGHRLMGAAVQQAIAGIEVGSVAQAR